VVKGILILLIVLIVGLMLFQSVIIFPGAFFKSGPGGEQNRVEGAEILKVKTLDGLDLEAARLPGATDAEPSKLIAIGFHGNGGDLYNFFDYQRFFAKLGITSYGLDYRGYGNSEGWPSASGFYKDAQAIVDYAIEREGIEESQIILYGVSIGTGVATWASRKYEAKTLLLFSPYTSMRAVARSLGGVYTVLSPLVYHNFPSSEFLKETKAECLIVAHGVKDNIIPSWMGEELVESSGVSKKKLILDQNAAHNDILYWTHKEAAEALTSCLKE